jgi:hypothetical protein
MESLGFRAAAWRDSARIGISTEKNDDRKLRRSSLSRVLIETYDGIK